jgi:hypothetical protein
MLETNTIITNSLAPAVTISGVGLLISILNNRISTVGSRVRELNRELRTTTHPERIRNIRLQIPMFLERAYLIRNAMFLLFGALAMMVFTAVAIALSKLHYVSWEMVPAWTFLGGLILMLLAVLIETYETVLNLRTLALDVDHCVDFSDTDSNHFDF